MAGKGNLGWNPRKITKRLTRQCLECNTEFSTWPSVNSKYCSYSCKNKHILRFQPIWNKGKKSGSTGVVSGENHWNWKGGITSEDKYQRYLFNKNIQPKIFTRDNYTCQICEQYGKYLQVDHIKSWSEYPELRFNEDNCRTLCMACHYYITFKRKMPEGIVWGHNLTRRISQ